MPLRRLVASNRMLYALANRMIAASVTMNQAARDDKAEAPATGTQVAAV